MESQLARIRLNLWCVRVSGRILFLLFFIGWVVLARFVPAPSPLDSAEDVARRYEENVDGIRLGATFMMVSFCFWAPWGSVVANWTRRSAGGGRVLADVQIVSLAISEMVGVLCALLWALAAFRPGQINPQITQTLNDAGWLMFLLPWPPFSMWCVAQAVAVFRDKREGDVREFPRWTGYLSLLTAFLFMPAGAALFFKDGGYAYDGLLGMYLPLTIFFVWVEGITLAMTRKLKQDLARCERENNVDENRSQLVVSDA
ncbi:hypothetical protein ACFXG4_38215 [Nocardia sp. NPDC059246]|uniref:hypothetical protein n=1 Tax=unclassified Nocardia TaxID=2637762 RepID=UPI0036BD98F3